LDTAMRERQLPVLASALRELPNSWEAALYIVRLPLADQAIIWRDWLLDESQWEWLGSPHKDSMRDLNLTRTQREMFDALAPKLGRIENYPPLILEQRKALARRISVEILQEKQPAVEAKTQEPKSVDHPSLPRPATPQSFSEPVQAAVDSQVKPASSRSHTALCVIAVSVLLIGLALICLCQTRGVKHK